MRLIGTMNKDETALYSLCFIGNMCEWNGEKLFGHCEPFPGILHSFQAISSHSHPFAAVRMPANGFFPLL
jgi:hypothetical protein